MVVSAGIGVVALVFAIQELTENGETVPLQEQFPEPGGARTVGVTMHDNEFIPQNVSIRPGQTVVWSNADETVHTVTSTTGRFDSGPIAAGESYERTFLGFGVYRYRCKIHGQQMRGRVTVLGD